jgi:hypothetical protein
MYVFFEHHKDAKGQIVLTELKLTSYPTYWAVAFKQAAENTKFQLINPILKVPPVALRSYDPATYIWSYIGAEWGEKTLDSIEKVTVSLGGVIFKEVVDLAALATQRSFDLNKLPKKPVRPEDFFYNTAPLGGQIALSKEQLASKLMDILEVQALPGEQAALKKLYRAAAMRLHPDRNSGDGSKMSELNMYWQLYVT